MHLTNRIHNKIKKYLELSYRYIQQQRLKNKDFTIISNNCWGGGVYEDLNLPYATPFVGLFIMIPDYIELLEHRRENMKKELTFVEVSKYKYVEKLRERKNNYWPIGKIGEIEIQFMHYKTEEEAYKKWHRRKTRINWDNLFYKLCDNDGCTSKLMKKFEDITKYQNVIFSTQKHSELDSLVWLKKWRNEHNVGDLYSNKWRYRKYFDVVKWLNFK